MLRPIVASTIARTAPVARVRRKGRGRAPDAAPQDASQRTGGRAEAGDAFDAAHETGAGGSPASAAFRAALLLLHRGG